MERTTREVTAGDGRYRAIEAWRAGDGHGVAYGVALSDEGGAPADDDRGDRRFLLEPGEELAGMDEAELSGRLDEDGRPLTETERRFRAPDGRLWLAQSVGPVWAEDEAAGGLTRILFTSLEGPLERESGEGGHVGRLDDRELSERWRRVFSPSGEEADGS